MSDNKKSMNGLVLKYDKSRLSSSPRWFNGHYILHLIDSYELRLNTLLQIIGYLSPETVIVKALGINMSPDELEQISFLQYEEDKTLVISIDNEDNEAFYLKLGYVGSFKDLAEFYDKK